MRAARRVDVGGVGGVFVAAPANCQALITTTVTMAISVIEIITRLVWMPRFRWVGRTRERRGPSQSSPLTKRELYSST